MQCLQIGSYCPFRHASTNCRRNLRGRSRSAFLEEAQYALLALISSSVDREDSSSGEKRLNVVSNSVVCHLGAGNFASLQSITIRCVPRPTFSMSPCRKQTWAMSGFRGRDGWSLLRSDTLRASGNEPGFETLSDPRSIEIVIAALLE